jgi:signal peptidase I
MSFSPYDEPTPSGNDNRPDSSARFRRFILDVLETILISVAIYVLINFLTARIRIESISMQPTLFENDFVLVNKLIYNLTDPARGDIIVFRNPQDPQGVPYIKRVIGLPGDQVEIEDDQVKVNGILIREPYIKDTPLYSGSWQVPVDALFVLGDNRNYSSDSHLWGMVPLQNVIGRAELIYLPVTHWGLLHRSHAFAADLK